MTVALLPVTFNLGMGVFTLTVTKFPSIAPGTVTLPDMKLGKTSFVVAMVPRLRLGIGLAFVVVRRRRFAPRFFPLKRFFDPRGKNLPLASLGSDLASFLPLAILFVDFLRLRLGISSLFCTYLLR